MFNRKAQTVYQGAKGRKAKKVRNRRCLVEQNTCTKALRISIGITRHNPHVFRPRKQGGGVCVGLTPTKHRRNRGFYRRWIVRTQPSSVHTRSSRWRSNQGLAARLA